MRWVERIAEGQKARFRELLLVGDEQWDQVTRYLWRGELFAMQEDAETQAIGVVTAEGEGVYEVKNLSVWPRRQRRGYGRALLGFLADWFGGRGEKLLVGTGDAPGTLTFYHKCGFARSHVVRDFFVERYDHPIFEDGRRLRDMVYLQKALAPQAAGTSWAILPYGDRLLPAMLRVFRQAVHVGCAGAYTPEQLAAWAPEKMDGEAWARCFAGSQTRVAVNARGEVLGFANLEGADYLDCLYVAPTAQRLGIGTALCATMEALAAGDLEVRVSLTARPFFDRRGYRLVQEVRPIRAGIALPAFRMRLAR